VSANVTLRDLETLPNIRGWQLVSPDAKPRRLSPRERQILELLAEGLRVKEIADRLQLSPATVHTHVRNAIAKLEVDTRTEAVALAVRFSYLGAGGGAL
jgi:DNA-binding NarL/FixJ family response regulator